jgi:predicted AAA+ superfamily ATPase
MSSKLQIFLENAIVTPEKLHNYTHDPLLGKIPNRFAYIKLEQIARNFFKDGAKPNYVGLAGLRGVGKTTLMWQVADYIYKNHCNKIFSIEVDKLQNIGFSLQEAIDELEASFFKKQFNESFEPFVLLLDEVHDDKKWAKTIKILHDNAKSAFVLMTGSSALLLQQSADLAAGRMHIERVFPFKFTEFILAKSWQNKKQTYPEKGLSAALKQALLYEEKAEDVLNSLNGFKNKVHNYFEKVDGIAKQNKKNRGQLIQEYISYHNIPRLMAYQNPAYIRTQFLELLKRIINSDVPKFSSDNKTQYIQVYSEKILFRLAASDEINLDKLSQTLGEKKATIEFVLEALGKAELLNILSPYGGIDSRINKNKKAFFMSPSLRRAILSVIYGNELPEEFRSKMMEDLIVMYLKRIVPDSVISFMSSKDQVNPDFILETRENPIIIEAGLGKSTDRQVTKSKINYRYGIIISSNISEPSLKGNSIFLPFEWFLML